MNLKLNISLLAIIMSSLVNVAAQDYLTFNQDLNNATVRVENLARAKGSGCLISQSEALNETNYFLATNKHILGQWSIGTEFIPDSFANVMLYLNDSIHPVLPWPIKIIDHGHLSSNVYVHPNPLIDLLLVKLDFGKRVEQSSWGTKFIPYECLLPMKSIPTKGKCNQGNQVFFLGFPASKSSKMTGQGLLKSGTISSPLDMMNSYPWIDDKTNQAFDSDPFTFIMEANARGGNSGGPVFIPFNPFVSDSPGVMVDGKLWNYVIGIISAGNLDEDVNFVISADNIIDLIDQASAK